VKKSIFLLSILIFLSGCSTLYNPATGKSEFIFINSATETAMGQSVSAELLKKQNLSKDSALQGRVRAVGYRIAQVSDRKDIAYQFFVIEDKELNAFTIPGGTVYVNRGLMDILDDDELAYVLAHETGHVAARHIAKKIQANLAYQLILGIAFAAVGDQAGSGAQTISDGANAVFGLVQLSYSRKDEFEADKLGLKYAYQAGFNPRASITALEKLKKNEGPNWKALRYFRTHPYVDERIEKLKAMIPELAGESGKI